MNRLVVRLAMGLVAVLLVAPAALGDVIPNGDFSNTPETFFTTNIPNWSVVTTEVPFTDQVGIFFTFDGVLAQGSAMALIATSPSVRDTATAIISDPFVVGSDVGLHQYLRFDYRYVSGHSLDQARAGSLDPFTVSIVNLSDPGGDFTKRVHDGSDPTMVDSVTDFGPLPSSTIDRIMPAWGFATVNLRDFVGDTVQVVFIINDSGATGGNSGVFIDNVQLTPEPGTMALFGLGLAGLGFAIQRRRSARATK